jgi:hypothetical protein
MLSYAPRPRQFDNLPLPPTRATILQVLRTVPATPREKGFAAQYIVSINRLPSYDKDRKPAC